MLPSSPKNYISNRYIGHVEFVAKKSSTNVLVGGENLHCFCICYFGVKAILSNVCSFFGITVRNVLFLRPNKEMLRINTPRIVALMENGFRIIKLSKVDSVRSSASPSHFGFVVEVEGKSGIPIFALKASKFPTFAKVWNMGLYWAIFVNFTKKPLNIFFGRVHDKQNTHRPAKVMSAQMQPQSRNDGLNLFETFVFSSHIKAACSFA